MNQKKLFVSISLVFITIEILLGVLVQTTSGVLNTSVSFCAVVLCFLYSLFVLTKEKSSILLSIGLFCTVMADVFLVVLHAKYKTLAMVFFSVTQIAYFIKIYLNQRQKIKFIHLIIRSAVIIIALIATVIVLKDKTDLLSLISLFYYANLVVNIVFSFIVDENNLLFSIGLIFFACCDLLIGFDIMASSYIELKEGTLFYFLANPGFNLAWVFYVPSQLLISLSGSVVIYKKVFSE